MKPVLFRQVGRDGDSIALFSVCLNLKRQIMRILFAVAYLRASFYCPTRLVILHPANPKSVLAMEGLKIAVGRSLYSDLIRPRTVRSCVGDTS
jgi:hypothetical protein